MDCLTAILQYFTGVASCPRHRGVSMPRSNMGVPSSNVGASRSKGVSSITTSQLAERIYCSGIVLCITTHLQTGV